MARILVCCFEDCLRRHPFLWNWKVVGWGEMGERERERAERKERGSLCITWAVVGERMRS